MPEPLILFLHLPKAGGSTLAHAITRQYKPGAVLRLYDSFLGEELAALPPDQLERLRVAMGHFYFGTHHYLAREAVYVTMLRDPIDRVISHYFYVRGDPSHYLHERSRRLGLKEYVQACGTEEPNNDQARLLAGPSAASLLESRPDEVLALAKENLATFVAFGLVEQFDRSLMLLKRALGWRLPVYLRENRGPAHPTGRTVSAETLRVIQTHNQVDIELYRHAKRLFEASIARQGPTFGIETRTFATVQAVYSRVYPTLSGIRQVIGRA